MHCRLLPLLLVALAAAGVRPLGAQAREADPALVVPERLHVKLVEGSGAEWRDGTLISRTGADLASVAALFAAAVVSPLVTTVSWDELDRWHRQASAVQPPHNRPGHLGLWFRLTLPDAGAALELHAALRAEPLVQEVYFEPRYEPAGRAVPAPLLPQDLPPPTPLMTHLQLTHGPSPDGHGVRAASGILGARGQGVRVVMIEQSWILDHEDVSQVTASRFLGPVAPLDMVFACHGTSGASMICADRNLYGMTGIADEIDLRLIGLTVHPSLESCIALGLANSVPADVLMIVLVTQVPILGSGSWVPVEYFQATFDAVLTATSLGRHVIAAGGNGNLSLDDPALLNRFNRAYRDSGAVIVAASQAGPLLRVSFSNWGSRLDVHSWGEGVASCCYGTLFFPNNDYRQAYTIGAAGTSASAPQVGGLVASIQGAARRQLGQPLSNAQLLALLHGNGPTTPDVIGRRPDLPSAFAALGILDGLQTTTPDLQPGDTLMVQVAGPPGTLLALFGATAPANLPIGLNRNLHLDPAGAVSLAIFALGAAPGAWTTTVPNLPSLHGTELYFQAVRLAPGGAIELTNSCQSTIL
jgi:hypothetical protein